VWPISWCSASAWAITVPNPRTGEHAALGRATRAARCCRRDDITSFSFRGALRRRSDALLSASGRAGQARVVPDLPARLPAADAVVRVPPFDNRALAPHARQVGRLRGRCGRTVRLDYLSENSKGSELLLGAAMCRADWEVPLTYYLRSCSEHVQAPLFRHPTGGGTCGECKLGRSQKQAVARTACRASGRCVWSRELFPTTARSPRVSEGDATFPGLSLRPGGAKKRRPAAHPFGPERRLPASASREPRAPAGRNHPGHPGL
jgi:hypothetical protein